MVLADSGHRVADRPGHATRARSDADAARRSRPPRPIARDSSRTRNVAFGVRLRSPLGVSQRTRLVDVIVDLGEAPTVRLLRPCVEDLARISE